MKMLIAMAALAVTLGINGVTEIWELPAEEPTTNWVRSTETPTVEDRACLIIPIVTDEDGFANTAPEIEWVYTAGLTPSDIRVGLVGHYLNIAFDPLYVDSYDMELTSIDVDGLSEITICKPSKVDQPD